MWADCQNKLPRDMVDRLGVGQEVVRLELFHYWASLSHWLPPGNKWIEQSEGREKIWSKTGDHWLCHPGLVWGQQGAQWQRTWRHSRGGSHQVGEIYWLLDCKLNKMNLKYSWFCKLIEYLSEVVRISSGGWYAWVSNQLSILKILAKCKSLPVNVKAGQN